MRRAPLLVLLACAALAAPAPGGAATDMSRPGAGGPPTPVAVNLYLADLYEISGTDQTFLADVVLMAQWTDPRLAGNWPGPRGADLDEIWNPRLQVVNERGITSTFLPQRVEIDPSGRVLYRRRLSGRFTARMDLRDFPMDRQRFHVQVVSLGNPRSEVALTEFPEGMRVGRAQALSVTDWAIGPTRMEPADLEPAPGTRPLAGLQLIWEGHRYQRFYYVQVILPLVMIVLMGWTALWIATGDVTTRMSIAVTTMLTVVAYRFALGRLVPSLPYLTRFDYFMLGTTVLVFLMVVLVGSCAYLAGRERRRLADRIDTWARRSFPVLFAALGLLLLVR